MRGKSGRQAPARGWPEALGGGSVAKGSGPSAPIQAGKGERGLRGVSGGVGPRGWPAGPVGLVGRGGLFCIYFVFTFLPEFSIKLKI